MIINQDFRALQDMLVDFASTRQPDHHQEKIDQAAAILRTVHTLAPADAHAQLLTAADLCRGHAFLNVNILALADMLVSPQPRRSPTAQAPARQLRSKLRTIPHMGAGSPTDTPDTQPHFWWKDL